MGGWGKSSVQTQQSTPNSRIALSLASLQTIASILSYITFFSTINTPAAASQTFDPALENPGQLQNWDGLEETRQELMEEGNSPWPELDLQPEIEPTFESEFDFYRLGPGDGIAVSVQRFPDLSFQASLDLQGNITVPLLGKVSLAGLTLEEAREQIRFGLNRFVIDPTVFLTLTNVRPVQVTVIGEVLRPGFYPLNPPAVSSALLVAGGTSQEADLRNLRVRRVLIDGSVIERTIDLLTPLKNGESSPELRLENGDVVIVPQLDPNDLDYDRALAASSTLAQPQIRIRVLSYPGGGIGSIQLPNGSSFVDAVTAIRPSIIDANLRKIALIRFDPEQQRAITYYLDGKQAFLGDTSQDLPLRDNDVIVIGRNLIARVAFALNRFTQPFRDILGFLLFFDQLQDSADDLFGPDNNNNRNRRR